MLCYVHDDLCYVISLLLHPAAVLIAVSPSVLILFAILETFILLSISLMLSMYVHHLGLYCILFRRFVISKINTALQLTKL